MLPTLRTHVPVHDSPAGQLILLILVMVVDSEARGDFCQLGPAEEGCDK